jgi:single-strand DNA-binding protein
VSEIQLSIVGYVGGDVQSRTGRTGTDVASFRLAATPRYYDRAKGGWTDGVTTWLTVVCYRSLAKHVAASVKKGDPVLAVGRLRTQSWTRRDGSAATRDVLEAVALGHDLTRGTSVFRKTPRPAEGADEAGEVGAVIEDAEQAHLAAEAQRAAGTPVPVAAA